jgi:DNA-binding NtrC family response regulator
MSSDNKTGDCSILIVDDEPAMLNVYKKILEEEGYCVKTASSRTEALEILGTFTPRILFLDCRMGGMTNALFKQEVEKIQGPQPQTRLIGFSSYSEHSTFAREMQALLGEFFEKPDDIDEFLNLVRQLCFGEDKAS